MKLKKEIVSNKKHHFRCLFLKKQELRKRPNNKCSAWRLEQVLMPSERQKKRSGTSQEKHVSFVGRRDILLGIRVVQQTGEKCAKCSKYGHFASCCKGNHSPLESSKDSQQKKASNGKKGAARGNKPSGRLLRGGRACQLRGKESSICICCNEGSTQGGVYGVNFKRRNQSPTKLIVGYCVSLQSSWRTKLPLSTNLMTMKSYLAFRKRMRLCSFGCSFLFYAWESKQGSGLFLSNSKHLLPWGILNPTTLPKNYKYGPHSNEQQRKRTYYSKKKGSHLRLDDGEPRIGTISSWQI